MRHIFIALVITAHAAFGNSYSVNPVNLPKPEDVVYFTNGLLPSTGERNYKTKDDIIYFIRFGKFSSRYLDRDEIMLKTMQTRPAGGVFVDKAGQFYFWTLISPTVLQIETPEGACSILKVEKARSAEQGAEAYGRICPVTFIPTSRLFQEGNFEVRAYWP